MRQCRHLVLLLFLSTVGCQGIDSDSTPPSTTSTLDEDVELRGEARVSTDNVLTIDLIRRPTIYRFEGTPASHRVDGEVPDSDTFPILVLRLPLDEIEFGERTRLDTLGPDASLLHRRRHSVTRQFDEPDCSPISPDTDVCYTDYLSTTIAGDEESRIYVTMDHFSDGSFDITLGLSIYKERIPGTDDYWFCCAKEGSKMEQRFQATVDADGTFSLKSMPQSVGPDARRCRRAWQSIDDVENDSCGKKI